MKISLGTITTVILLILSGCCTQRTVEQNTTVIQQKDSANTEVRIEKVIEYVTDTLYIEIPPQTAERTIQDSVSHLENDYAISEARINYDGTLYHDLRTKSHRKLVEYQRPVEHRDSVRVEYVTKTEYVDRTERVEYEKKLTWWQSFCIRWFPWQFLLIVVLVCVIYKKPILGFFKKLLL